MTRFLPNPQHKSRGRTRNCKSSLNSLGESFDNGLDLSVSVQVPPEAAEGPSLGATVDTRYIE